MVIQVNQELCAGCGAYVEACAAGAILLVDQRAVIDDALCIQGDACIDACPNGAIAALSEPIRSMPITTLPAAESQIIPVQNRVALPETEAHARSLIPLAGAALTFLGHEVAPRLANMLLTVLERRLAQPVTTTLAPVPVTSQNHTTPGRGKRRQTRYRGGRAGNRNHKEKR